MSAFNFGGSSNTPSPAPAPATGGGFSFGGGGGGGGINASVPATGGTAPTFGATAPGGSNTPAPPAAPGGFSFGGGGGNAASPSTAAAPALGASFSSGGAPAPVSTAAPNPAPAFAGFSGTATPSSAPTGGSFSVTGSTSASSTAAPQHPSGGPPLVQASDYAVRFPGLEIWSILGPLIDADYHGVLRSDSLNGQTLIHALRLEEPKSIANRLLSTIQLEPACTPNQAVRQQMATQMAVQLSDKRDAPLLPNQLQEILEIADDLLVSEPDAVALYHHASQRPPELQFSGKEMDMITACRHLHAHNKEKTWQSWVMLWLARVQAASSPEDAAVIMATDSMLQPTLTKLISFVREASARIQETINRLAHLEGQTSSTNNNATRKEICSWDRYLQLIVKDRLFASHCLFFIAYQTQLTVDEVTNLVDLIRDLTNGTDDTRGLVLLDPYTDVPDPYEPVDAQAMAFFQQIPTIMPPPQWREKDRLVWQRELVGTVWNMGQPQLLRCVSTLVMCVLCALDTKNVLLDRETHGSNSFGVVREDYATMNTVCEIIFDPYQIDFSV